MGGGSKQEQPTQTTSYQLAPEQRQLLNLAMPGISQFAAQTPQRYQGEQVAGFTPAQEQAQASAMDAAGKQQNIVDQMTATALGIPQNLKEFQRTPQNLSSDITISPETWQKASATLNPAITAATNPIFEGLTEQTLPAIRGQAVGTSGLSQGGSRQGVAEGIASGKASRAAGDVGASMTNQLMNQLLGLNQQRYATNVGAENQRYATDVGAEGQRYGQNLSALYQTLGLTPSLVAAQTAPAGTMAAVGEAQQALNQARINEAIQNFNFDQYGNYLKSKDILGLVQGIPGGSTVSTANMPSQNKFSQALGGAASGASMGSMFGPWGTAAGAAGGAIMPFLFK